MKYAITALAAAIVVSAVQPSHAGNLSPAWIEPEVTAPSGVAGIVCTPFTFWRKGCGGLRLRGRDVVVTRNRGGDASRAVRTSDTPDRPQRTVSRQTPRETPKQTPKETPEKTSTCTDCDEFKSDWDRKRRERAWERNPNWDPAKAGQHPNNRSRGKWEKCFTPEDRARLREERQAKKGGKNRSKGKGKGKGKKG